MLPSFAHMAGSKLGRAKDSVGEHNEEVQQDEANEPKRMSADLGRHRLEAVYEVVFKFFVNYFQIEKLDSINPTMTYKDVPLADCRDEDSSDDRT